MASDRNTAIDTTQILKHTIQLDDISPDSLCWNEPVIDKDLTSPPGGESEGDRYIVASGASGDWTGHTNKIAQYINSSYTYYTPLEGWITWVKDENKFYYNNGSSWNEIDLSKLHTQNTDTDLDATFEATFVKKTDTANVLSDITSTGANIEDAVTKKHTVNEDTALGAQSEDLDMNTHKITGVVNPVSDQDAETKKHVADTYSPIASPTFTTKITTPIIDLTGGQIAFPATAVPSVDPNTLDDYEEGTYTVTIICTTSGTVTILATKNTIAYTKIGRVVHIQGSIKIDSVSSPVGTARFSIPFTCAILDEGADNALGAVAFSNVDYASTGWVGMQSMTGQALAALRGTSDAGVWISESANIFSANDELTIQLTYISG